METTAHSSKRLSLYWQCQFLGWGLTSLYWAYQSAISGPFDYTQALFHFIGDFAVGIFLTHLYRHFALRLGWHTLNPGALVPRLLGAVLLLGLAYMCLIALKLYLVRWLLIPGLSLSFGAYFSEMWLTLFATGIRLMAIWVLAWHMYHYAQREIRTTKQNAQLAIMVKEAQLSKLSAQLNPHFFFNALNTIKFLVAADPASARRGIDLLSDLLRNSLYVKDDSRVSLEAELALVNDYLELEKLRFEERLQIAIVLPEKLPTVSVPPLCIQSLVENAIKHGIDREKEGGTLYLCIETNAQALVITVRNPGTLNTTTPSGLGLKNLQERLVLQYNGKASLVLKQPDSHTVEAQLTIPLS